MACSAPTIAGTPNSGNNSHDRWTASVGDIPAAFFMIGCQSGSVLSVTRISPSLNSSIRSTLWMTRVLPVAILLPTLRPEIKISPRPRVDRFQFVMLSGLNGFWTSLNDKDHGEPSLATQVHRRLLFPFLRIVVLDDATPAGGSQASSSVRANSCGPPERRERSYHLATIDIVDELELFARLSFVAKAVYPLSRWA